VSRRAATRAELFELDRRAMEEFGIPSERLMESAARAVVAEIESLAPGTSVTVFVGKGNNGGDGHLVAKMLAGGARRVLEHNVDRHGGFYLVMPGIVVDAIFGIGLSREVTGRWRDAIEAINASGQHVIAVDIPSGLDPDTGRPLGVAVRANTTVTFGLSKVGFDLPGAATYTGRVVVADIGYPPELLAPFESC
jgi:NAD(P)H-hydrate epimerase